ncbi:MAG: hypothetical protein NT038_08115 [Euryarchaeota archaeon]|nr:hypothetical protein [Euryarchaeota archaeon]
MTEYNPDFKQPPWVYGPSEVMDWIESSHPTQKKKDKKHGKTIRDILRNLHVCFDFQVEPKKIKPSNFLSKIFYRISGNGLVTEGFELVPTAELVLRGLARAKFRHIIKIIVDDKTVYNYLEKDSDLRKTIDNLGWITHDVKNEGYIEVTAILDDDKKSVAIVKIMKIHREKEHSVDIQIKGEIKKELYHAFLNYLHETLGLIE